MPRPEHVSPTLWMSVLLCELSTLLGMLPHLDEQSPGVQRAWGERRDALVAEIEAIVEQGPL